MVRFIQYWIERGMESPEEREEKTRKYLQTVTEGAEELKKRWAEPSKPPGYWLFNQSTAMTKARLSQAEADILSPYDKILDDMDASKRLKEKASGK